MTNETEETGERETHQWEIISYPDKRLRRKSEPIAEITDELRTKALALADLMYESQGIGLAAPQVGWPVRLLVINLSGDRRDVLIFANPEIISKSKKTFAAYEACLSVPGVSGKVTRPREVKIRAMNMDGDLNEFDLDGMLARCFLHELDHLEGVLFIDRLSPAGKQAARSKLRRLEKGV